MDAARLACVLAASHSQWMEEQLLLPSLLEAAGGRPGTFVELGALDGVKYSNTLALEACYNWTGLLIEANPSNYAKAQLAGRRATLVHSAVCDGVGTINITAKPGPASGAVEHLPWHLRSRLTPQQRTVAVPCRPLAALLSDAGLAGGATFLSLDVEGAEAQVKPPSNRRARRHRLEPRR